MATGLPSVNQRERISIPGVVDTGGSGEAWQALSEAAGQLADEGFRRIRNRKIAEFEEAGQKAVTRGDDGRLKVEVLPGTDQLQRAYNQSARAAYLARAETDAQTKAVELQNEHWNDPDSFRSAFEGYKRGVINNAPPEFAPTLQQKLEREQAAGYASILSDKTRIERRQHRDALETKAQSTLEDAIALAREGTDGINSTEFQRNLGEYEDVLSAQVSAGYISQEQKEQMVREAESSASQNALSGRLVESYRQGGMQQAQSDMAGLRQDGVKGLNSVEVDEAIQDAQARISQLQREQSAARGDLRDRMEDHIASLQATGTGVAGVNDQAQQLLTPDELQDFTERQRMARRVYSGRQTMLNGTPGEIAQTLEQFRPAPGSEDFARKQEVYSRLQGQAQDILDERATDPAAYAKKLPDVQQRYQAVNRGQATLEEAISYNLSTQRELGIPRGQRRAIPKSEAQSLVQEVQAAPASERAQLMNQLQRDYGKHFDEVFQDLTEAGLEPGNQVLASTVGNPALSQQVANVIELGNSELKKPLGDEAVKTVESAVENQITDSGFREVFAATDFSGASTRQLNAMMETVKGLAYLRAQQQDPNSAAESAVKDVVTGKFHIVNDDQVKAFMPRVLDGAQVKPNKVQKLADFKLSREQLEQFDPATDAMPGAPEFLGKERLIRTAVNSGFWVNNDDNTGMVLMVPDDSGAAVPLTNEDGDYYEIGFTEASRTEFEPAEIEGDDLMAPPGRNPRQQTTTTNQPRGQ
jgi:hypothetical protein